MKHLRFVNQSTNAEVTKMVNLVSVSNFSSNLLNETQRVIRTGHNDIAATGILTRFIFDG